MRYRGLIAALVVSFSLVGCPEFMDGVKRGIDQCGGESAQLIQDAVHTGQSQLRQCLGDHVRVAARSLGSASAGLELAARMPSI